MSINNPTPRRRLVTIAFIAEYLGVTERTVRNYISAGHFPAYRIPRTRGVRLDLDEVTHSMKLIPAVRARSGANYGPKARIIDLPPQPRRVEAVNVKEED
jgi:excisionase family DNA binding protein